MSRRNNHKPAPLRLVLLLLITALALLVLDGRGSRLVGTGRSVAAAITSPVSGMLGWVSTPLGAALDGATGDFNELRDENEALRAQLAELQGQVDQAANNEAELADLRSAVGIEVADALPTVVARVTADRTTPTNRELDIDRGAEDGVGIGQSVITGEGLIGQVIAVEEHSATVRPITDPRIVLGVTSPVSGAVGVAEGQGSGRRLVLKLVERDREVVRSGANFVTSGFDRSVFPPGIPVGSFQLDSGGSLTLVPSADLERPGFVSVVLTEPREPS
ncbi:MAG: rod shape-determining protein MreC [Acidimicrobiales bacterium]|nr:rod shape-determining protein MreC [Acidimicrobiales bacterium]